MLKAVLTQMTTVDKPALGKNLKNKPSKATETNNGQHSGEKANAI